MESHTKVLGHPAHAMSIVFPLGLLSASVLCDTLFTITRKPRAAEAAWAMLVGGLLGGAVSAPLGYHDWKHIPEGTRAKTIGRWHGWGNVVVMALFLFSALRRKGDTAKPDVLARTLSLLGGALAGATGWLGGELMDRLGVGIDDGANLDAPLSLSGLPADSSA